MGRHSYLLNRNGYYYFRVIVPARLVPTLGMKEIVYSLKTKHHGEALAICPFMLAAANHLFSHGIKTMRFETEEQVKPLLRKYFKECLERFSVYKEEHKDNRYNLPGISVEPHPDSTVTEAAAIDQVLGVRISNNPEPYFSVTRKVLSSNNITMNENSHDFKFLATSVIRAVEEVKHMVKQYHSYQPIKGQDELFTEILNPTNIPVIELVHEPIKALHETYCSQLRVITKTINQKKSALKLWLEIVGDKPVNQYAKADGRKYKEALAKLPSNPTKRYPGKSTAELLAMDIPANKRLNDKTLNDYLKNMRTFFTWYQTNYEDLPNNPLEGMNVAVSSNAQDDRHPFSTEQLTKIFTSPIYKGCQSTGRRTQPGELVIKDSQYWVPLIGLYSGARLNEICQLYTADVKQKDGVWVFDINQEGDDKSLKTPESKRLIPVHPYLIQAGFLDYVQTQTREQKKRLFSDIEKATDHTYSGNVSKWFGRYLNAIGAKTSKTTFHSFRHSFTDALRVAQVQDSLIDAITGHKTPGVTARYGTGHTVATLKEAIDRVTYPGTIHTGASASA